MSDNKNDNNDQLSSVITERLKVAKTVDTTLSEDEEEYFAQAAQHAKELASFHRKQWIVFTIVFFFMVFLLIYLLTFVIKFY